MCHYYFNAGIEKSRDAHSCNGMRPIEHFPLIEIRNASALKREKEMLLKKEMNKKNAPSVTTGSFETEHNKIMHMINNVIKLPSESKMRSCAGLQLLKHRSEPTFEWDDDHFETYSLFMKILR